MEWELSVSSSYSYNGGSFRFNVKLAYNNVWRFRTELCRFSGAKIYPGRGIRFIRSDSQVSCGSYCFVIMSLVVLVLVLGI